MKDGKLSEEKEYFGHVTHADGSHTPLSKDEAAALWKSCEDAKAKREADWPTSNDALRTMFDARQRMKELGWGDATYCPKDGSTFAIIQYGSTGIFPAHYDGRWPSGRLYCCDYFSHPDGALWKSINDLTPAEKALMEECEARDRQMAEREIAAFAAMDQLQD